MDADEDVGFGCIGDIAAGLQFFDSAIIRCVDIDVSRAGHDDIGTSCTEQGCDFLGNGQSNVLFLGIRSDSAGVRTAVAGVDGNGLALEALGQAVGLAAAIGRDIGCRLLGRRRFPALGWLGRPFDTDIGIAPMAPLLELARFIVDVDDDTARYFTACCPGKGKDFDVILGDGPRDLDGHVRTRRARR